LAEDEFSMRERSVESAYRRIDKLGFPFAAIRHANTFQEPLNEGQFQCFAAQGCV
jgi:hypothetical protein